MKPMQRMLTATLFPLIAAGTLLLGSSAAQDSSAGTTSKPAQSSSAQSSTSGAAKAPAKKTTTSTAKTGSALTLKTQKEKNSYALGMSIGTGLKRQGVGAAVDPTLVSRGLRDAIGTGKTAMTEDEMRSALTQLRTQVQGAQEAKAHQEGAVARKEGEEFLAANKSKPGVQTLPDGLQYKVVTEGTGPKPTANDTVTVNYRGTLINGKEFDSSYKRGQPVSFPVGGVIKGWTEALQLMPVGSKWQLFIPPDLAYGDRGAGTDIGPGETLIFDVELISIGEQKK
ncbi:MAG TPA: FKBP-type peptidyl-prolyl cis-trans isomerase [Candidatus Eisenbacteria bacterium]|nr:FKBP-type peptidyl-prolyl cis-trans isomerase [Candidatus Eisenbacteria bacterium]